MVKVGRLQKGDVSMNCHICNDKALYTFTNGHDEFSICEKHYEEDIEQITQEYYVKEMLNE